MKGVNWHEIDFKEIENGKWIITTQQGMHFSANQNSVNVLKALKSTDNIHDAFILFKTYSNSETTYEQFHECVKRLSAAAIEKRNNYLTVKVPLLNAKVCAILAKPFTFLFTPKLFWFSFIILAGVGIYTLFTASLTIEPNDYIRVLALFYAAMLLHEIGHISACVSFNARPGAIGGGFYFIFPVLYADISNIWLINKHNRIIVNLAGVFAELLFAAILIGWGYFQNDLVLITTAYFVIIRAFFSLNPFLRGDGYWVLSDLTSTPNLLSKANNKLTELLKRKTISIRKNDWLLISYSIINTCLLITVFSIIALKHHQKIIEFPSQLISWIANASAGVFKPIPLNYDLLIVIAFYAFAFKILANFFKYLKQVKGINGAVPST